MRYVPFDQSQHRVYVNSVLLTPVSPATRGIVAVTGRTGAAAGVCLLDGWTHTACNVHLAVQNPMCLRGLLHEVAHYIFITCDKQMAIGIVEATHEKALKINKHIGFKEIYRVKDGYAAGVDQIVMQLLKKDCRFLDKEYRLQEVA